MSENINVLGKGFEYEERTKIKRIQEILSGTIVALVGGANWGPISKPTFVQKDFEGNFGTPLTKENQADSSGLSADYVLDYSPFCWYTRIADGSETLAQFNIFKAAEAAEILGTKMLRDTKFVIYEVDDPHSAAVRNNMLKFVVTTPDSIGDIEATVTLAATPGCSPVVSATTFPTVQAEESIRNNWNYILGSTKNFNIDDIDFRYIVRNEYTAGTRNPDTPDFLDLVVPVSGTYDAKYAPTAIAAWFEGVFSLPDTEAIAAEFDGDVSVQEFAATEGYQTISNSEGVMAGATAIGDGTFTLDVTINGVLHEIDTGALVGADIAAAIAGLEASLQASTLGTETITIDVDDKIRITGTANGTLGGTVLIEEGIGTGFIAALTAIAGVTAVIDTAVDGDDATYEIITIAIEADVAGVAGNTTITGDGIDDIATLLGAGYTVAGGNGTKILEFGEIVELEGGADVVLNTSTSVTIIANTPGVAGNIVLTGDGNTIEDLIPATHTLKSGDGTQILKTGETVDITGGAASGTGQWISYTPAVEVNTYAKRFVYAFKKYIVVPKLQTLGFNLGEAQALADLYVTTDGVNISLNSLKKGATSVVRVFSIPKIYNTSAGSITSRGTDTDIDVIITAINNAIQLAEPNSAIASIDPENYNFILTSYGGGADYGIQVDTTTNSLYSALGLAPGVMVYGTDAIADAGTFIAKYTGTDGNTIIVDKAKTLEGYTLTIFFQGFNVASFFNYSYDPAASNFIGTLIASDPRASKIVELQLPVGMTQMPALAYGQITLAGGTSGISNLTDTRYNLALDEYKNIDLYSLDLITVSGHTSQSVHDKLEEICEYRRDCFTVVDAPEDVAGTVDSGGNIYRMIDWHNGIPSTGRTKKLTSKFVSTYFPYVSIPDGTINERSNYYAPTVRVMGAIANSDKFNNNQFAAPAGNLNAPLNKIHALAQYVREDEKARLYADELDNNVNPLVYTTSRGFFIDGQKNCARGGIAISRLNVLRTSLYIKKRIYEITPNYFWKPLNKRTQDEFAEELRTIGIYLSSPEVNAIKTDYVAICDATINDEITEARRGLIGVFEWTPIRSIEKIKVISIIRDLQVDITFA